MTSQSAMKEAEEIVGWFKKSRLANSDYVSDCEDLTSDIAEALESYQTKLDIAVEALKPFATMSEWIFEDGKFIGDKYCYKAIEALSKIRGEK